MTVADKLTRARADYDEVYEAGKKKEHDAFWSVYTGNSWDWRRKFANIHWTDDIFKPPFTKIVATQYAGNMFQNSGITDGLKRLTEIDVSATNVSTSSMSSFANSAQCTYYPIMRMPPNCNLNMSFSYNANLVKMEKLCINENNTYTATFMQCSKLTYIRIEGIIGNSISFEHSPLDRESITDIIGHLSSSVSGRVLTLKKEAKEAAFTTEEWAALIATKPNWAFDFA